MSGSQIMIIVLEYIVTGRNKLRVDGLPNDVFQKVWEGLHHVMCSCVMRPQSPSLSLTAQRDIYSKRFHAKRHC